jgi:hypothetical protein
MLDYNPFTENNIIYYLNVETQVKSSMKVKIISYDILYNQLNDSFMFIKDGITAKPYIDTNIVDVTYKYNTTIITKDTAKTLVRDPHHYKYIASYVFDIDINGDIPIIHVMQIYKLTQICTKSIFISIPVNEFKDWVNNAYKTKRLPKFTPNVGLCDFDINTYKCLYLLCFLMTADILLGPPVTDIYDIPSVEVRLKSSFTVIIGTSYGADFDRCSIIDPNYVGIGFCYETQKITPDPNLTFDWKSISDENIAYLEKLFGFCIVIVDHNVWHHLFYSNQAFHRIVTIDLMMPDGILLIPLGNVTNTYKCEDTPNKALANMLKELWLIGVMSVMAGRPMFYVYIKKYTHISKDTLSYIKYLENNCRMPFLPNSTFLYNVV